MSGRREVKHGNSSSVRMINQSFPLPKDIDVSKLSTEVSLLNCVTFPPRCTTETYKFPLGDEEWPLGDLSSPAKGCNAWVYPC